MVMGWFADYHPDRFATLNVKVGTYKIGDKIE